MEKSTVNIFNDILDSDILTYLLKDSKMDLDGVRLKIAYMKNQEILQNHPYEIWQGKNGRWYTHVPDDTKPEGRRKIAKSTREKIEDEIIKGAKARQLKGVTIQPFAPVHTLVTGQRRAAAAGLTKTMAPRREDTIVKEELPHVSGDIADFHRNVAAVIRDGAEPEIKLFQVMRVMKLMEAIFQSAETNQVIDYRQYES